jgi:hypothetical protein
MAKSSSKRKEKPKGTPDLGRAPASLLKVAYGAFEQGDKVLARKAAKRLLELPEVSKADEAAAKEISPLLFASTEKAPPRAPKEIATELIDRMGVPPQVYIFGGLAAAIIVLLIILAAVRT